MKRFMIFLALGFMIFTGSLTADNIIIEDAEDGTTAGWSVYDNNPPNATISNVIDEEQGKVIALNGDGKWNGYMLGHWGSKGFQLAKKKLSWKMKYNERFSVYIIVGTEDGNRYLWYTPEDTNIGLTPGGRYVHHGLGADVVNGEWHTFTRDLEADLKEYAPELSVQEIKAFLIRGSGYVDDIISLDNTTEVECDTSTAITREELIAKIHNNEDVTNVNTCAITNMSSLFYNRNFNQDISGWDVSNVTNMSALFYGSNFNQDISGWDVSNVTNMSYMFMKNSAFDQNLSSWDVSNVTNMDYILHYTSLSTENYDALLIGWSKLNLQPNVYLTATLLTYSPTGKIARDKLVNTYNWRISDLGLAVNPIFEECNTDIDSTVLYTALSQNKDFLYERGPSPEIINVPLTQGDTFFFKLGNFGFLNARLYRVNCKDHSKVEALFLEEDSNMISYAGSIGDVAYFNNYHDTGYFGAPFSISSEGEPLQRISFISNFLAERGLYVFGNGLRIINGKLDLSTSDGKAYVFSPDGTLLESY